MAKIKPKIVDQGSAMERILGFKKDDQIDENIAGELNSPEVNVEPEKKLTYKEDVKENIKKQKYTQTAFYITPEQHKALKLRAIKSDDPEEKDMSAVVRKAVNLYLGL